MSRFGSEPRDRSRSTRERRLKLYPFCAHCEAVGIQRLTVIIDHKIPLAFGGADDDENCQGLCAMCEAIKTASEQASQQAVQNHPRWLEPSISPVFIVVGPPCGGKTTMVRDRSKRGDLIIDLDEIAVALQPGWDRRWNSDLLNRSIRVRNAMLGSLSRVAYPCVWFIVASPSEEERQWWCQKLGDLAVVNLCDPGVAIAFNRASHRDGRTDHVADWYARRSLPWAVDKLKKAPRVASDADGYPLA